MNPVTHATIGYLVSQPLQKRRDRALVTLAAVLPDLDGLAVLWGVDQYNSVHHTFGHSLLAGLLCTGVCLALGREKLRIGLLAFLAFHIHIAADLIGSGAAWPVMYFWPVSDQMFTSAPPLQWELVSWQNMAITLLALVAVGRIAIRRGRTFFEFLSLRLDLQVVRTLRARFGNAEAVRILQDR